MEIKYPETLIELWKFLHHEPSALNEKAAKEAATEIIDLLANFFPGTEEKDDKTDPEWERKNDYACECFTALFGKKEPESSRPSFPPVGCIRSKNILIAQAKKYLAKQNNPVQYEMNDILCEALHALKDNGEVDFDAATLKFNILTKFSSVALINTPDWKKSSMEDYERNKEGVGTFSMKIRGNSPENTRMITPKDAQILVRQLLTAFEGWVKKTDLLQVMKNHITEQLQVVPELPWDDEEDDSTGKMNQYADNYDSIVEFDRQQAVGIAVKTSDKIWEEICKISSEVFCLYSLPKLSGGDSVDMKKLGKTSTVSDQNKKIKEIMQSEIQYRLKPEDYKMSAMRAAVEKIYEKLVGKCTESGYNPRLNSNEVSL